MELKISFGRRKDRAQVVEVAKKTLSEQLDAVRVHLLQVHTEYAKIFDELRSEAEEESRQEKDRGVT